MFMVNFQILETVLTSKMAIKREWMWTVHITKGIEIKIRLNNFNIHI